MKCITYMVEKQRKLTSVVLGGLMLVGGLVVPCSDAKYSAYSIALAGLFSVLVGSHAYQRIGEISNVQPDPQPDK